MAHLPVCSRLQRLTAVDGRREVGRAYHWRFETDKEDRLRPSAVGHTVLQRSVSVGDDSLQYSLETRAL